MNNKGKRLRPKSILEMGLDKCDHPIQYHTQDLAYGTKPIYKTRKNGSIEVIDPNNIVKRITCGLCWATSKDLKEWKGGKLYAVPLFTIRNLLTKEWWDDRLFEN